MNTANANMARKIPLDVLSAGVTDSLAETATLREQCKSQQEEIKSLSDHKLVSEIEIEYLKDLREIFEKKLTEKDVEIRQLHELL